MPELETLSAEEKSFFDTKGDVPEPAQETLAPVVAPEPAKAAAEPAKAEAAEDGPEPDERAKNGILADLIAERAEKKLERTRREKAEADFLKLSTRLDTLQEIAKAQAAKPAEAEIPDINTDPVGHFKAKTALLEKELNETKSWRLKQEEQTGVQNNVQRIGQLAIAHEAEFTKTTPDYNDASTFLRNQRDAELKAYGIMDPAQRNGIIAQDALNIAAQALADGKNPAEIIYGMSQARGYQKKPAGATKEAPALATDAGLQNAADQITDAMKVAMAAAGQKAGQSLGQVNGAAKAPLSIDALLKMSDDEFADATKGNKFRQLLES